MSAALSMRGVGFTHPGASGPTLTDVDLDVEPGEMVTVLGPSGSGKSTLLRIAAGLEQPRTGAVLLGGTDVRGVPAEARDVTMMFQKPHLFPHLDVRDNVAFADRLSGVGRRAARVAAQRYLDLVHLDGLGRRRPRQLSGGQEQRVALARALAARRRVMLLDEPFSSLDTGLRRQMHELLIEVRAALAPTVVMVTHDLDEAGLAERVAVLVEGRIEQFGPVVELYTRPATLAVARLVGGFNELPGEVVDGHHHSPLGPTPVRDGCRTAGPATALVRREQLELIPDSDRRTGHTADAGVAGLVVEVRMSGPRLLAAVEVTSRASAAPRMHVELPLDQVVAPGERVRVRHRPGGVWAVADPGPTASPAPHDALEPR